MSLKCVKSIGNNDSFLKSRSFVVAIKVRGISEMWRNTKQICRQKRSFVPQWDMFVFTPALLRHGAYSSHWPTSCHTKGLSAPLTEGRRQITPADDRGNMRRDCMRRHAAFRASHSQQRRTEILLGLTFIGSKQTECKLSIKIHIWSAAVSSSFTKI